MKSPALRLQFLDPLINPGGFRRGIDEATLRQIAQLTGGQYCPAESAGDLEQVFASLPMSLVVKHESIEVGAGFAALGGLLTGLGLLLGRLWRPLPWGTSGRHRGCDTHGPSASHRGGSISCLVVGSSRSYVDSRRRRWARC